MSINQGSEGVVIEEWPADVAKWRSESSFTEGLRACSTDEKVTGREVRLLRIP